MVGSKSGALIGAVLLDTFVISTFHSTEPNPEVLGHDWTLHTVESKPEVFIVGVLLNEVVIDVFGTTGIDTLD